MSDPSIIILGASVRASKVLRDTVTTRMVNVSFDSTRMKEICVFGHRLMGITGYYHFVQSTTFASTPLINLA